MSQTLRRSSQARKRLVIVGNGPATGRLLDLLVGQGALERYEITVFGEEPQGCYNRVLLSRVLSGVPAAEIINKNLAWFHCANIVLHAGVRVLRIDRQERMVVGTRGITVPYDNLVLATGSRAVIPTIPGLHDDDTLLTGAYVFRTLEDCEAILHSVVRGGKAVVLGGGLLGLEAAKGLADLGMTVRVVDRSPGPMARQLDVLGQSVLRRRLAHLGIKCIGNATTESVLGTSRVEGIRLTAGEVLPCDLLVMACGIQPRIELPRSAGLLVKKAMVVNEWLEVEADPRIYGIGECVEIHGELFGTVEPIWKQADVLVDRLLERKRTSGFCSSVSYTKLKVAGVEVASFGGVKELDDSVEELTVTSELHESYLRLRITDGLLTGAQLVGDTSLSARLLQYRDQRIPVPENRFDLLASGVGTVGSVSPEVCNCHHVLESTVVAAIENGASDLEALGNLTCAGTGCGSCQSTLTRLLRTHVTQSETAA